MGSFDLYLVGWQLIDPQVFIMIFFGTLLGIIVGALPGLTATMAVSIIVPLTYKMSPVVSILMLLGVYCGGNYGGSISACLINIPGTPSAIMTGLDGHPLARRGKAGLAIGMATLASVIGGLFSVFILAAFSPIIANIALKFKSLEIFGVALFGLSVIAYVSPGSTLKGIMVGFFGLLVATIGFDPTLGVSRFGFGSTNLLGGIDFVSAMIGLFGMSEMLANIEKTKKERDFGFLQEKVTKTWDALKYIRKLKAVLLRSSIVGVIIGAIPGAGGTIAAITAYGLQKKVSKYSHLMGQGSLEGIAAPESSNNACTGGAMTPLLSLGIPGDAVTAVLIGAFIIHGIVPGPMMYTTNPDMVSAIFIGMLLANIMILLIGMPGAKYISKLLKIPSQILNSLIIALCIIGTFAIKNSLFDTCVMLVFGGIGYLLSKAKVPKAPIVLALVLGPIMEENLRRWASLAEGKYWTEFVNAVLTNPVTLSMVLATLAVLLAPVIMKKKHFSEDDIQFTSTTGDTDPNEIIFAEKKK
ncbi:MAG: tripartite tricarboxylate transporter permease [Spirochaetales bacterium]|nr:tripartite tricarboxylate transporter permease [Spirochaetales bacterium]